MDKRRRIKDRRCIREEDDIQDKDKRLKMDRWIRGKDDIQEKDMRRRKKDRRWKG